MCSVDLVCTKIEDSFKGINVVIIQIGHQATRSHRLCCHGD